MSQTSFVHRKITVTFNLGTGPNGQDGTDSVTLTGYRVQASIIKAGGNSMGSLQMRVFGMPLDLMNRLSTLGMVSTALRRNTVSVSAGDDVSGMTVVFQGTIKDAWADFQGMPDVSFNVVGFVGGYEALAPAPAVSFRGGTSAATIMSGLAKQMGLKFENSQNVAVQLSNPYFSGTARQQAETCARDGDFEWLIDNGTLAIWPKENARGPGSVSVSPETGLRGYPGFSSYGVTLSTLFIPTLVYGSAVRVTSSLKPACGLWIVFKLEYDLASETPGGPWFCEIEAARPGYVPAA